MVKFAFGRSNPASSTTGDPNTGNHKTLTPFSESTLRHAKSDKSYSTLPPLMCLPPPRATTLSSSGISPALTLLACLSQEPLTQSSPPTLTLPAPSLLPPAVIRKCVFTTREPEETPFWFKRATEGSRVRECSGWETLANLLPPDSQK